MKDFFTALMMAWGNFLSLPCPKKVWDTKLRKEMLTMLPLIGLLAGFLSFLLSYLLCRLMVPISVSSFFMTLYTFGISGFMHADGFMDCCDAILSRRDIAERQRILKDSKVGAFAVISMILMALGTFAAFFAIQERLLSYSVAISYTVAARLLPIAAALPLVMIPVISRATAGSCVLGMAPLKTSQYAESETEGSNKAHGSYEKANREKESAINNSKYINTILIGVLLIFFVVTLALILLALKISFATARMLLVQLLIPTVITLLATRIFAGLARKNLGGMSGDIAGFSICMGELIGLISLALMRWVLL